MVKFFINRPIFATVLALIIVVAGWSVTLNILPIAQYPEITPPTVQVSAVYPGADAQISADRRFTDRATGKRRGRYALHEFKLLQFGAYS